MIEPRTVTWEDAAEHKAALLALVARMRKLYPDSRLGVMRGGWSSPKVLADHREVAPLIEWARSELGSGRIDAWANVLEHGDEIREHDHRQAIATAIYCVEVDPECGVLLLPDEALTMHEGAMVVLDGKQAHSVPPYEGQYRASIVMNVYG